jgi:hypothetical protein
MYDISGANYEIGDAILSGEMDGEMDGDDMLGEIMGEMDGDAILSGDHSDGALMGEMLGLFRRHKKHAKAKNYLRAKKASDGKLLKELRPNKWRRQPLGFVQLAVPAAGTVTVTATPQNVFKGQRLTIPAVIGVNFVINSLFVGVQNQFVGAGAIPAITFAENAVGEDLNMDTAQIGNTITMNVTNLDGAAAHDFRASLTGDAVLTAT